MRLVHYQCELHLLVKPERKDVRICVEMIRIRIFKDTDFSNRSGMQTSHQVIKTRGNNVTMVSLINRQHLFMTKIGV